MKLLLIFTAFLSPVSAQEAASGFELRSTLTTGLSFSERLESPPRAGSPLAPGVRLLLYPTFKISRHWTAFAAVQGYTRPYFYEQFGTQGRGLKADVLQAHLSYARFWNTSSLNIRVGQLSSAFGSFLLRYDDAVNPVIDMPAAYGYYYKPVTTLGLLGAQIDATRGRFDARAQFVNSSPANRRSLTDSEQYGSWAGGGGYTIRQGFRIGASAYRGPYLHRQYRFYFPGEAPPRQMPGTGLGLDIQWGHGPWSVHGELQRFEMTYRAIPDFRQHTGYGELRRVLHPRWYVAARIGYLRASAFPGREIYDWVVAFRPNVRQLIKAGYQVQRGGNTLSIQLVTTLPTFSRAR